MPSKPVSHDWSGTERYEVVRHLGSGGMGAVYEARDRESGQSLAIKTLLNATPAALYLFKQEFRTLADVDHPNLVRLYEFVMAGSDHVFFTMELIRGTDLLSHVRDPGGRGPLDVAALRSALVQLVEGVMALHAARKLHRDIKPSNVLVTEEGRVVLLDFGVATEIARPADTDTREEHEAVGTATYMAPEQAFEEPTTASDWYSVGVMLYEALVGRPPFVGSAVEVLTLKSTVEPRPPSECAEDVPSDLDTLCRALLQYEPAMRPAGAAILRRLGGIISVPSKTSASGGMPAPAAPTVTPLVGREMHTRVLREAFDAARSGHLVTVRVAGRAGMGKSALVHRFLDDLAEGGDAVVLRGRTYERVAVPYKAVDGLIDALSRHLMGLPDEVLVDFLPEDMWAVARLFPVLRRVPAIDARAEEEITDPQSVRRRAFRALRELLSTLATRRPLVLLVDDAQWGDTDSAALLLELIRPPNAPPLLLAMACREEEEGNSPFLRELRARSPQGVDARELVVGALDEADARALALSWLGSSGDSARATADAIARESDGSPFVIEELARSAASQPRASARVHMAVGPGTLRQMLGERLAELPPGARRCLEIIAVGGRPVPVSVAIEAADIQDTAGEAIAILRSRRFVRADMRGGREVLEVLHDHIRAAIVAQQSPEKVREHNGRLAHVLEAASDPDVEALAAYLFGAGNADRAVEFAERAAEEAVAKLAFDQAAHLLGLTLETFPASSEVGRRLRRRLGEILEWAGQSAQAGHIYLEIAQGAPADQRLDLERAAAEQLHASGLMDEGTAALRRVLTAVGVWAPSSPLTAFLWLLVQHLRLRMGMRFRERQLRPEESRRLDALNAVALGFSMVDYILGTSMKARLLVAALRAGDRRHALRGAALVALDVAGWAGAESATQRALLDLARRLAEKEPDAASKYTLHVAAGLTLHYHGRFRASKEALDPVQAMSTNRRVGQQNALLFTLHSLQLLGEMTELTDRYTRALNEAEERGNLLMSVVLRTSTAASVWLAADDPARARRELRDAMARWAQRRFSTPEWRATLGQAEVDLYEGDFTAAYERIKGLLRAMEKNFFLLYYCRALVAYGHGRAAIASLPGLSASGRRSRLRELRRLIRILAEKRAPWTAPLAAILEAGRARAMGDLARSHSMLRTAIASADANEMTLHAAAARHELGLSLGGDEAAALVGAATEAMTTRGVLSPERFAPMLVPGQRTHYESTSRAEITAKGGLDRSSST